MYLMRFRTQSSVAVCERLRFSNKLVAFFILTSFIFLHATFKSFVVFWKNIDVLKIYVKK